MTPLETEIDASQVLRAAMEAARQRFPQLGLSFGYIGNLERWGDDRCWRIFTKLSDGPTSYCNVSWGRVDTNHLAALATPEAIARFEDWLQKQACLLAEGKLRQVNRDAWLPGELAHAASMAAATAATANTNAATAP